MGVLEAYSRCGKGTYIYRWYMGELVFKLGFVWCLSPCSFHHSIILYLSILTFGVFIPWADDHSQGLEFSDSILRSEPSQSFLPRVITFLCISTSLALHLLSYLSLILHHVSLSLLLFVSFNRVIYPHKAFWETRIKGCLFKSWNVKDPWRKTWCRDSFSSDLSKSWITW